MEITGSGDSGELEIGTTLILNGTNGLFLYDNNGVLGEITGLTKAQADTYYYPLFTNPAGYLTSIPNLTYIAVTGTYAILTSDQVVECTSGTFTATLPTAVGVTGKIYYIKNTGTGKITVNTTSSQTIDGDLTQYLIQYESLTLISNGANWLVF